MTDIKQLLSINIYNALVDANSPSAANPFATIADITAGDITLPTNDILVGNASNKAAAVAMSGDATIVASGALTVAATIVKSVVLNTPNVVFATPVTFTTSTNTATGTLSLNTQTANTVFAGPTSGGAATPTFRALTGADFTGVFTAGSVIFAGSTGGLAQDNSQFFWDNTNFRLGIGTASPVSSLQVISTATTTPRGILQDQYSTGTNGGRIDIRKARGTVTAPTVIVTGDVLGSKSWWGYDGANFIESAKILATSAGTVATGSIASTMMLQTFNVGTVGLVTAITIDQDQLATFANTPVVGTLVSTDNSTKAASTAFVTTATSLLTAAPAYTALSNNTSSTAAPSYNYTLSGFQTLSSNTVLTASSPPINAITGTYTITLPVASTCIGKMILFTSMSSTNCTIDVQGTDNIYYSSSFTTSWTLNPGSQFMALAIATNEWKMIICPAGIMPSTGVSMVSGGLWYSGVTTFPELALSAAGTSGQLWSSAGGGAPVATSTPGSATALTSVTSASIIGGLAASSTLTVESTSGVGTSDAILFKTGSQVSRAKIDTNGNIILNATGSALVTSATNGFTYMPNCAGVPTGTPASIVTGATPMIYDTTHNRIYYYNSAWNATNSTLFYQHTIFTPVTTGTIALINNIYNIVNPAGTIAALTITLPSSPLNNDAVYIKFTQTVTAITYSGGTVQSAVTTASAGTLIALVFDSGTSTWY